MIWLGVIASAGGLILAVVFAMFKLKQAAVYSFLGSVVGAAVLVIAIILRTRSDNTKDIERLKHSLQKVRPYYVFSASGMEERYFKSLRLVSDPEEFLSEKSIFGNYRSRDFHLYEVSVMEGQNQIRSSRDSLSERSHDFLIFTVGDSLSDGVEIYVNQNLKGQFDAEVERLGADKGAAVKMLSSFVGAVKKLDTFGKGVPGSPIQLSDPEFMAQFNVHATQEQGVDLLLNQKLRAKLLDLVRTRGKSNISLIARDGKINLIIRDRNAPFTTAGDEDKARSADRYLSDLFADIEGLIDTLP